MTIVTPADRPKSVRNRYVIKVIGGVFVLCFRDLSVGVGALVPFLLTFYVPNLGSRTQNMTSLAFK